jgi:glycosyltransferase involved in cell wall biosynthesis
LINSAFGNFGERFGVVEPGQFIVEASKSDFVMKPIEVCVITRWPETADRLKDCLGSDCTIAVFSPYPLGRNIRFRGKLLQILEEGVNLIRLLFKPAMYQSRKILVCEYCHYSTLAFGRLLKLLGICKPIYVFNFYLHNLGKRQSVKLVLRTLFRGHVGLMVQSRSELAYFESLARSADIQYTPYCRAEVTDIDWRNQQLGDYVFAGGYTNRDYDLLVRCASRFPNSEFVIVCSELNVLSVSIPQNVRILKDISSLEFHQLMAGSRLVVVPLKEDVGSSGQMVAIAAMQLGKATIYADFDVVAQYFENGISGVMYRPGNVESLVAALSLLLNDARQLEEIGAQARLRWERNFRPEVFRGAICAHLKEFVEKSRDSF